MGGLFLRLADSFLLTTSFLLISLTQAPAENNSDESVEIKIDGIIDDREWNGAKVFKDFYITIPETDSKDYDSTLVYVKQDSRAIYFAFKIHPRGKVISKSLIRDVGADEDNEIIITLDLENKNRNGYTFYFNYINNQRDFLVYNERSVSSEWDWIWENKTIMKNGTIFSEIMIPVDKLQNKNNDRIGINVTVFAYRPDGTGYYYSLVPGNPLNYVRNTYKLDIRPFEERLNLNFNAIPFIVADKFNDSSYNATMGGDLNVSLDKHKLKGTYNTDESTLEADPYRFEFFGRPVFLFEKRPFFSKDLDIYRTPINLFYTRAIQNINWGLNYTFRSNNLKTGIVYAAEEKNNDAPGRKFFALRPTTSFDKISLGTMFIYSQDKATGYQERILSFDGYYRLPLQFRFRPQVATNFDGTAYSFHMQYEFQYTGGPWGDLVYRRFDEKFNSLTMFNNYGNDNDEIIATLGYIWKYDRNIFSDINLGIEYYKAKTLTTDFIFQEYISFFSQILVFDWLRYNNSIQYNKPNDIENERLIKRDNFLQQHDIRFLLGSNSLDIGYFFGRYLGTYLKNPYAAIDLIFFSRINLNLSYNYRSFYDIKQSIYRIKIDYKVIDKLYLRSFFQKDTYARLALWNSLLQYEFFAGSNIYFVLNLGGDKLQYTGRYFKFGYEFNF